jgi:hypothetical protein
MNRVAETPNDKPIDASRLGHELINGIHNFGER